VSIAIPQPFRARVEGPIGPVSVSGVPTSFTLKIADPLPKISVGLDPLRVTLDPVKTDSKIAVDPLRLNIGIDRIPDVRAHLPASFSLNICVLGFRLLSIGLCGEAQVITEPYRPNPCERCGQTHTPPGS
jgi:hypothetical protein